MALNTNPGRISHTGRTSSKALTSLIMRTSSNLVAASNMVASSILAQTSNTARTSNSTAKTLPMEAINSNRVRISNTVATLSEGAHTCRITIHSLLRPQEARLSKVNMGNKDSMGNSISPHHLDSKRSTSQQVRVILIHKPTEANSAARLTSMPISHRDIVHPQLAAPSSTLLPHLEHLPEDTTLPTTGVMGTTSPLTVTSRTTAVVLLLFLAEAIPNNNMGDLTEGLTRSCTENHKPIFF
jgi:hypothetical protein